MKIKYIAVICLIGAAVTQRDYLMQHYQSEWKPQATALFNRVSNCPAAKLLDCISPPPPPPSPNAGKIQAGFGR